MSPQVPQLNLFPARVELPEKGELREARVFVYGSRALVFHKTPTKPVLELRDVVQIEGTASKRTPAVITFADGSTWSVYRDSGCGCGHPLKRFSAKQWVDQADVPV